VFGPASCRPVKTANCWLGMALPLLGLLLLIASNGLGPEHFPVIALSDSSHPATGEPNRSLALPDGSGAGERSPPFAASAPLAITRLPVGVWRSSGAEAPLAGLACAAFSVDTTRAHRLLAWPSPPTSD